MKSEPLDSEVPYFGRKRELPAHVWQCAVESRIEADDLSQFGQQALHLFQNCKSRGHVERSKCDCVLQSLHRLRSDYLVFTQLRTTVNKTVPRRIRIRSAALV